MLPVEGCAHRLLLLATFQGNPRGLGCLETQGRHVLHQGKIGVGVPAASRGLIAPADGSAALRSGLCEGLRGRGSLAHGLHRSSRSPATSHCGCSRNLPQRADAQLSAQATSTWVLSPNLPKNVFLRVFWISELWIRAWTLYCHHHNVNDVMYLLLQLEIRSSGRALGTFFQH